MARVVAPLPVRATLVLIAAMLLPQALGPTPPGTAGLLLGAVTALLVAALVASTTDAGRRRQGVVAIVATTHRAARAPDDALPPGRRIERRARRPRAPGRR